MLRLSSPLTQVPRIGPAKAAYFKNLGAGYVRDLLFTFPRRYDDFTQGVAIENLEEGKEMTVRGRVKKVKKHEGWRGKRKLLRLFVEIEDDTGVLHVTWYNLRFLEQQLVLGREIYVAGTVEKDKRTGGFSMRSPAMEFVDKQSRQTHTASITPVYSETYGISSRFIRYLVKMLLPLTNTVPEYLPREIVSRHTFMPIQEALRAIHFPSSREELEKAQQRLRFDELFFLQLAALVRRSRIQAMPAPSIRASEKQVAAAKSFLSFSLTGAQEKAIQEIMSDLKKPHPMNRLLQGDVGSGKSAVAVIAARLVLNAGYKVIYLAPTEILARQQADYAKESLGEYEAKMLIGALPLRKKEKIKKDIQSDKPCFVIGTHALLQEDVTPNQAGLIIIDEQHRFGVEQRKRLQHLRQGNGLMPHLLSMTATPIPRTLNLTVYGDLDVSVLDELPPGRKPITTRIIPPAGQDEAIVHVLEELHQGRQAYVIAPLVEKSDRLEVKSATEVAAEMKKLFPGIAVGLMHGQMKTEEKESVMRNFAAGAIQLLVSTSVVEVGINVPNATVMMIEGAERFGLAQLHQFRGRVGRGPHASYCYLFPSTDEAAGSPRLHVLARTLDGFKIAEEDLRLRGPGEVYGVAQSGFGNLRVASLLDYGTIKLARNEAQKLLRKDKELKKYPILRKKIEQKNMQAHFE